MIFCAVTGPMPGSASSCSAVATLNWTGPTGAPGTGRALGGRDRAREHRGHEYLLAVRHRGSEVERRRVGPPRGAAGARDRVGDSRPGGKPVEPRPPHSADHVDDEPGRLRRSAARCAPATALRRPDDRRRNGCGSSPRPNEEPRSEQEHRDEHETAEDHPAPGEHDRLHATDGGRPDVTCLSHGVTNLELRDGRGRPRQTPPPPPARGRPRYPRFRATVIRYSPGTSSVPSVATLRRSIISTISARHSSQRPSGVRRSRALTVGP